MNTMTLPQTQFVTLAIGATAQRMGITDISAAARSVEKRC